MSSGVRFLCKFSGQLYKVMFFFTCLLDLIMREWRGGGGGRDHLKCLRLQPGGRAGEKLSNEEKLITNFITNSAKPSKPHQPPYT